MKKICFLLALVEKYIITFLIICVFSGVSAQSHIQGADTSNIDTHKHSVGVNVGWLDGLSLKFNFGNNIYLLTDFGFSFHANPFFFIHETFGGPWLYADFGVQLNLIYENRFSNSRNTFWFAGGGVSFGKECTESFKSPYMKTGVKVMLGIEWKLDIPLSLQLDTRQGYGVIFTQTNNDVEKHLILSNGSMHFFDYSFVFSVRYHFGNKN